MLKIFLQERWDNAMDDMTMMSVQCNIILNNGYMCGLPPIGRCDKCMRAYCASHWTYNGDAEWVFNYGPRMCAMCAKELSEENRKRSEEWYAPIAYFANGTARDTLRKSGVQVVKLYEVRRWIIDGFLMRRKTKRVRHYGHGWVIGTFTWHVGRGQERQWGLEDHEPHTEECMTALLDVDYFELPSKGNYGLVRVRPYTDGYEILSLEISDSVEGAEGLAHDINKREALVLAGQAIGKLAGVPDDTWR